MTAKPGASMKALSASAKIAAGQGNENYALQRSFAMASAKIADARNKQKKGKDRDMGEFKREVQMVRPHFPDTGSIFFIFFIFILFWIGPRRGIARAGETFQ